MNCVELSEAPRDLVRRHLADAANGWSVGTWGAIGEFQYDEGEPGLVVDAENLSVSSRRGALRVGDLAEVKPFALVDEKGRIREIAFCSARPASGRTVIHALDAVTFDLGIGVPHIDMLVCLREDDVETRRALEAGVGRPLLTTDNPAGPAIGKASPTRVFASAFATLEVHQPIPPPGGRSPEGPHSHLLPHHLKEGRMHAPGSPLPAGLYCGLSLYPRTRL
ncbi:hypothetical protein [uncultured Reyranella sp.]|uniref:DUF6925 family protein n=1 Tax=uncultured Reyranella sp. TaxID=735512 RepID=UPI00259CFAB1|nr:hypothetical protein [uncultured Reyranella sp.]